MLQKDPADFLNRRGVALAAMSAEHDEKGELEHHLKLFKTDAVLSPAAGAGDLLRDERGTGDHNVGTEGRLDVACGRVGESEELGSR
jgi:hypothetical protein